MQQITNITSEPKQSLIVRLDNGETATLQLEFVESQMGWFFSVFYNDEGSTCHRVTNCPNIIRECKNTLPFGIACTVEDGQEPYFIDDFSTGRATLYVLNADDVKYVESEIYGQIF